MRDNDYPEADRMRRSFHGSGAEASVRISKSTGEIVSVITVGLRLIELHGEKEFFDAKFQQPPIIELSGTCKGTETSPKKTLAALAAYAIDGTGYALRHARGKFGVVLTRFEGVQLLNDWRQGAKIATALACFIAMGNEELALKVEMLGWERR
jgi:hypothetical protein